MGSGGAGNNLAHMILRSDPPYTDLEALARMQKALYYLVKGVQRDNWQSADTLATLLDKGYLLVQRPALVKFYQSVRDTLKNGGKFSQYQLEYPINEQEHTIGINAFLSISPK